MYIPPTMGRTVFTRLEALDMVPYCASKGQSGDSLLRGLHTGDLELLD
jgi:hypothetical protein